MGKRCVFEMDVLIAHSGLVPEQPLLPVDNHTPLKPCSINIHKTYTIKTLRKTQIFKNLIFVSFVSLWFYPITVKLVGLVARPLSVVTTIGPLLAP